MAPHHRHLTAPHIPPFHVPRQAERYYFWWKFCCSSLSLLSIVMPKTEKESVHLRLRSLHIVPFAKFPTGITNVLSRLHFKPDTEWNRVRILEKFLRFSSVLSTIALKSSAKISDRPSVFAKTTPVKFFV